MNLANNTLGGTVAPERMMRRASTPPNTAAAALSRPSVQGIDVTTRLCDFAIVSFTVDPKRLRALLPSFLEPDVFTLADGSERALVSAVPFRDADFRMVCLPGLRFAFNQINYRAYVKNRGERAVWFFGTMLGTPLVAVPRYGWKLPWHGAHIEVRARWEQHRCVDFVLDARGAWGTALLRCSGTAEPAGLLDGFATTEETSLVLTHPLRGYYRRRDGRLGTYAVWHERLEMTRGVVRTARFSVFEDLGLVRQDARVHSVLLQQETELIIQLPPQTL